MINQRDKDGNRHGLWEEYWSNGALRWRSEFKNGKNHGIGEHYYISGQLDVRFNYKTGGVTSYQFYHEDGRTWVKGEYKNVKKRGLWYEDCYTK